MTGKTIRTKRHTINRIFIYPLIAFGLQASLANAYENGTTQFSWQANPAEENVAGYRLYYGSESRFDGNGNLKSGFSYNYYIDLSNSLRCNNLSYDNDCEYLARDELSCNGLGTDSPICTLSYLQGTLHLAMTAYTSSDESGYTHEIRIEPATLPPEQPPEEPLPEEPSPGEPAPEEPSPGEPSPEEPSPEEPAPEEPSPGVPSPEEPSPGVPSPGVPEPGQPHPSIHPKGSLPSVMQLLLLKK